MPEVTFASEQHGDAAFVAQINRLLISLEPPGCTMVLTPAMIRVSGPSENGKKASLVAMARQFGQPRPRLLNRDATKSGGPFVPPAPQQSAGITHGHRIGREMFDDGPQVRRAVRVAGSGRPAACSQVVASVVRLSALAPAARREWS